MPDFEVRFWQVFLAREPAPLEKVEHALATLNSWYANAHRKGGSAESSPLDFMYYRDIWLTDEERMERDMAQVRQGLGSGAVKRVRKTKE